MPPKLRKASKGDAPSSSRRRTRARATTPPPSPPTSPLPWALATQEQTQRYKMLKKRKVVSSKFFDTYAITHLGIRDEVTALLEIIGWTHFANFNVLTYEEVTYEILSTLHADLNPQDDPTAPCIFFRCLGIDRALNLAQFNAIFGFPNQGIRSHASQYNPSLAWQQLTGQNAEDYLPSRSKSTALPNHALRYIHRVMAHSLFGRGLSHGVVNKVELLFLWGMVNAIPVNTGVWLLRHLLHVAQMPSGNICVGGILSIIADAFGFVPLPVFQIAEGTHLVDIEHLMNMRICRNIGQGQYRLLDEDGQVMEPGHEEEQDQDPMHHEEENAAEHMQQPYMGGPQMEQQPDQMPPPPQHFYMQQLVERMDRLETSNDAFQRQVLAMLQRQEEAQKRMEDRMANWK